MVVLASGLLALTPGESAIASPSLPGPEPSLRRAIRGLVRENDRVALRVRGASMWPMLRQGDLVLVERVAADALEIGDIAAVWSPRHQRPIAHRVVALDSCRVVTRGDNVWRRCETAAPSDVIGRVVSVERRGKRLDFGLGCGKRAVALLASAGLFPAISAICFRRTGSVTV